MADFRLPQITAPTTDGKVGQIQAYLYQLTEQLQFALNNMENDKETIVKELQTVSPGGVKTEEEAVNNFNSIKALIIKIKRLKV